MIGERVRAAAGWRLLLLAALVVGALGACAPEADKAAFNGTDITGAGYGSGFSLTDHNGQERTLADYRGKAVTVFFGYTQCPDVCPTTLSQMAEVMRLLGDDADRLQVLFITVDPERDTQQLLAEYVPFFDSRFVGLFGDENATAAVAKEFRILYRKAGDPGSLNYTVDHSTGTYAFDPLGRLRLYFRHGSEPAQMAADIGRLIAGH